MLWTRIIKWDHTTDQQQRHSSGGSISPTGFWLMCLWSMHYTCTYVPEGPRRKPLTHLELSKRQDPWLETSVPERGEVLWWKSHPNGSSKKRNTIKWQGLRACKESATALFVPRLASSHLECARKMQSSALFVLKLASSGGGGGRRFHFNPHSNARSVMWHCEKRDVLPPFTTMMCTRKRELFCIIIQVDWPVGLPVHTYQSHLADGQYFAVHHLLTFIQLGFINLTTYIFSSPDSLNLMLKWLTFVTKWFLVLDNTLGHVILCFTEVSPKSIHLHPCSNNTNNPVINFSVLLALQSTDFEHNDNLVHFFRYYLGVYFLWQLTVCTQMMSW